MNMISFWCFQRKRIHFNNTKGLPPRLVTVMFIRHQIIWHRSLYNDLVERLLQIFLSIPRCVKFFVSASPQYIAQYFIIMTWKIGSSKDIYDDECASIFVSLIFTVICGEEWQILALFSNPSRWLTRTRSRVLSFTKTFQRPYGDYRVATVPPKDNPELVSPSENRVDWFHWNYLGD